MSTNLSVILYNVEPEVFLVQRKAASLDIERVGMEFHTDLWWEHIYTYVRIQLVCICCVTLRAKCVTLSDEPVSVWVGLECALLYTIYCKILFWYFLLHCVYCVSMWDLRFVWKLQNIYEYSSCNISVCIIIPSWLREVMECELSFYLGRV